MKKREYDLHDTCEFGKHKGALIQEAIKKDLLYFDWALRERVIYLTDNALKFLIEKNHEIILIFQKRN